MLKHSITATSNAVECCRRLKLFTMTSHFGCFSESVVAVHGFFSGLFTKFSSHSAWGVLDIPRYLTTTDASSHESMPENMAAEGLPHVQITTSDSCWLHNVTYIYTYNYIHVYMYIHIHYNYYMSVYIYIFKHIPLHRFPDVSHDIRQGVRLACRV